MNPQAVFLGTLLTAQKSPARRGERQLGNKGELSDAVGANTNPGDQSKLGNCFSHLKYILRRKSGIPNLNFLALCGLSFVTEFAIIIR